VIETPGLKKTCHCKTACSEPVQKWKTVSFKQDCYVVLYLVVVAYNETLGAVAARLHMGELTYWVK